MGFHDSYQQRRASLGAAGGGNFVGRQWVQHHRRRQAERLLCRLLPQSRHGSRGPEIWLPWLDPVLIVGRNRVGKDTGIIVPNALMGDGNISKCFRIRGWKWRQSRQRIAAKRRRTWVANAFGELLDHYPDLKSDRVNLLEGARTRSRSSARLSSISAS